MFVSVLGPLTVTTRSSQHVVSSRQVGSLLALLALSSGESVSTSYLLEEFWPDQSLKNARNALHANISRLRRFLSEIDAEHSGVTVQSHAGRYRLRIPTECVDALRFRSLVHEADSLAADYPDRAARLYEAGLALWQGSALEDLGDLTALRAEKARLDELRLAALESLAEARLHLGEVRRVVTDLRHLVEIHGDREQLSLLLMLALYRSGQQIEALDVFNRVRTRLRIDFGVDPSRSLRDAQQAILAQDRRLDLGVAAFA